MATRGACASWASRKLAVGGTWPEIAPDFPFELLGLVGLADPLRASVPDAGRDCRSAGIRVVMITGDYPTTAIAIAQQAGLMLPRRSRVI